MSASLQSSKMQRALRELKQLNEEIDRYLADERAREAREAEQRRELTKYLTGTIFDPPMPRGISDEARRILERNAREEDSPLRDYYDSPLKRQGNQPLSPEDVPRLPRAISDPASWLLEQSDSEQDNAHRADDLTRNNGAGAGAAKVNRYGGNDPVNNVDRTGLEGLQPKLGGGSSGGHGASGSLDHRGASGSWDDPPGYVPMGGTPSAQTRENLTELREDKRPGGYSGGWLNPGNWPRGVFSGDPNAPDAVYDDAMNQGSAIGLPNPGIDVSGNFSFLIPGHGGALGPAGGGGGQLVYFWGDGLYAFPYYETGFSAGVAPGGVQRSGNIHYVQVSGTRLASDYGGPFEQISGSFVLPSGKGLGASYSHGDENASIFGTTVTAWSFGYTTGTPGGSVSGLSGKSVPVKVF